jgi:hypothetical protein
VRTTVPGPERESTPEEQAENAAPSLGRSVVGRDPTPDEADAMTTTVEAAVQALRHGFVRRPADHVVAERTDESVEEFLGGVINPN